MQEDRFKRISFAPLQGQTARMLIPLSLRQDCSTVVYLKAKGHCLTRSRALIEVLIDMGGKLSVLAKLARYLPSKWLDLIYRCVAKNRHRLPITCNRSIARINNDDRILP